MSSISTGLSVLKATAQIKLKQNKSTDVLLREEMRKNSEIIKVLLNFDLKHNNSLSINLKSDQTMMRQDLFSK